MLLFVQSHAHTVDWSKIASDFLSTSIVAGLVTLFINSLKRRSDFKSDYYKIITEKRLHALEEVTLFANELRVIVRTGNSLVPRICYSADEYNRIYLLLSHSILRSAWLSQKTTNLLNEIQMFCNLKIGFDLTEEYPKNELTKLLNKRGEDVLQDFRLLSDKLSERLSDDLKNLYKIEKFLKRGYVRND